MGETRSSRVGGGSRPSRCTPARRPIRRPVRSSHRSRCRRPSPSRRSASTRGTSTPARATRPGPPSRQQIAALERARHGLAFASGLAAEDNILRLLEPGQRILLGNDAYGGTFRLIAKVWTPLGLSWTAVDLADLDSVAEAWPDDTGMVWLETPTNPLLTCFDIEAIAELRARAQCVGRGRQHVRHAVPPTADHARRRHRRALGHEVPGRAQRRGRRLRRGRRRRARPSDCGSPRTPPAPCRHRSTPTSCCGA